MAGLEIQPQTSELCTSAVHCLWVSITPCFQHIRPGRLTASETTRTQRCISWFPNISFMSESPAFQMLVPRASCLSRAFESLRAAGPVEPCREESLPWTSPCSEEFQDQNASLKPTLWFSPWCRDRGCHTLGLSSDSECLSNYKKQNPLPLLANDFNISWRHPPWI